MFRVRDRGLVFKSGRVPSSTMFLGQVHSVRKIKMEKNRELKKWSREKNALRVWRSGRPPGKCSVANICVSIHKFPNLHLTWQDFLSWQLSLMYFNANFSFNFSTASTSVQRIYIFKALVAKNFPYNLLCYFSHNVFIISATLFI